MTRLTRRPVATRLLDVIGEGGVGVVFSARQASMDRKVAVKMLHEDINSDSGHRKKFLSEAVVTGELDHPNIVPVYELGTTDSGELFYSMKQVVGTPWLDAMPDLTLSENLDILSRVGDAIAFAHSRGVIHRDLKPENVMLGSFGEVLVMDWGIALSTSTLLKEGDVRQSASMGGTPCYMAPEMATGPIDKIGVPSDIYLLGAILYECVTGKPPHLADSVMACLQAAARNDILPTEHKGELMDIAMTAMATDPADRYSEVPDFQAAIRQYESHVESIRLADQAEEAMALARDEDDYQQYSKAIFGFQEALDRWEENQQADEGLNQATLAYASSALNKSDFDLGLSLLDKDDPSHLRLRGQLRSSQHERDARQQRIK